MVFVSIVVRLAVALACHMRLMDIVVGVVVGLGPMLGQFGKPEVVTI